MAVVTVWQTYIIGQHTYCLKKKQYSAHSAFSVSDALNFSGEGAEKQRFGKTAGALAHRFFQGALRGLTSTLSNNHAAFSMTVHDQHV